MDYMTLKEASEKWGVTTRWINYSFSFPMKFSRRFTHKTLRWPVFNQEKKFG